MTTIHTPDDLFDVEYDPTDAGAVRDRIDIKGPRSNNVERLTTAVAETIAAFNARKFDLFEGEDLDVEFSPTFKPINFAVFHPDAYGSGDYGNRAVLTIGRTLELHLEDEFLRGDPDTIDSHKIVGVENRLDEAEYLEKLDAFGYALVE